MSEVGLRSDSPHALASFVDQGGSLFDARPTSGEAIRAVGAHHLVIAASVGVDPARPLGSRVDASRIGLIRGVQDFLRATGLEHVDLLSVGHFDPHTPVEEVAETLHDLVAAGTIRYAGARGYRGWQVAVTPGLTAVHTPYSLLRRGAEEELIPAAEHLGVGVIADGPVVEHDFEALTTAAEGLETTTHSVAAAWTLQRVDALIVSERELDNLLPLTGLPGPIDRALEEVTRVG